MENVKVGDEVAVSTFGSYDTTYSFNWYVTKVTSSGRVTVKKDYPLSGRESDVRRFNNRGVEMGDFYRASRLEIGAERIAILKKRVVVNELRGQAAAILNQVRLDHEARRTWSTSSLVESLKELEEKLEKAKAAVAKLQELNPED